jgi:predicted RNA-binding Zn ribbon-like protein
MEQSESTVVARTNKEGEYSPLFVGDTLALAAINTERIIKGKWQDLMKSPNDLKYWWQQARLHDETLQAEYQQVVQVVEEQKMLEAFKTLRAALSHLFESMLEKDEILEDDLAPLNDILKMGSQVLEQSAPGIFELRDGANTHPQAQILLPIVRSAIWFLTEGNRSRLHRCQNPRCRLFFYDRTRSATRHWCSLKCMDRVRSARRYEQRKERTSKI